MTTPDHNCQVNAEATPTWLFKQVTKKYHSENIFDIAFKTDTSYLFNVRPVKFCMPSFLGLVLCKTDHKRFNKMPDNI